MNEPARSASDGTEPYAGFQGRVGRTFAGSESWWPPPATPPKGAPNVLVVMCDDLGFSDLGCFGSELTKDSHCSAAGPHDSWPCQRGFDRFYGILDGFTNQHHPHRLVQDNQLVEVDRYPDGYFFTDDITDRAIAAFRELKASNPEKPFFCYVAHGAVHAPLQAKATDIERSLSVYDVGWDEIRRQRHERLQALGIIAEGTRLAPRNHEPAHDVAPWADLDPRQRELFARYMALYAAMVGEADESVGRLRAALEELGEWENTLVLFTSDNGASREGEAVGTTSYYTHLLADDDWEADYARLELIGGPRTTSHYPRGWAMASNTPFRLYKINTHAGGHQAPLIVSWPAQRWPGGGLRRQFVHVTDVLPTLVDLCGLQTPTERNGRRLRPMSGVSFAPTLEDPDVSSLHHEQHYEMWGHRGFRRGDWEVVTLHQQLTPFGDHEWELYDLASDPTETTDLAAEQRTVWPSWRRPGRRRPGRTRCIPSRRART